MTKYKCYGKSNCPNEAPKEGMCEACSRVKYGTWLSKPIYANIESVKREIGYYLVDEY